MQARRLLPMERAEAKHDAELVRAYGECKCVETDDSEGHGRQQEDERARHAGAMHHLLHLVLAALQDLLEIGLIAAARTLAPRATTAAAAPRAAATAAFPAATTTTLIVPRH